MVRSSRLTKSTAQLARQPFRTEHNDQDGAENDRDLGPGQWQVAYPAIYGPARLSLPSLLPCAPPNSPIVTLPWVPTNRHFKTASMVLITCLLIERIMMQRLLIIVLTGAVSLADAAPAISIGSTYEFIEPAARTLSKRVTNTGSSTAFVRIEVLEIVYDNGQPVERPVPPVSHAKGTQAAALVASPAHDRPSR